MPGTNNLCTSRAYSCGVHDEAQVTGNSLKRDWGEATEEADWAYQYLISSDGISAYSSGELMLVHPSSPDFPRIVKRGLELGHGRWIILGYGGTTRPNTYLSRSCSPFQVQCLCIYIAPSIQSSGVYSSPVLPSSHVLPIVRLHSTTSPSPYNNNLRLL